MIKDDNNNDMNVKIQKGSPGGLNNNKGSCRPLAEYTKHEDKEREELGLPVIPFITPEGEEVTVEEVIKAIDANAKGLGKNDSKFFHIVVSPSEEEIQKMGKDDSEVYMNAKPFIKLIADAYAQNFHKKELTDSSELVMFVKPHFTRGKEGYLQFHLHAIVSRQTRGLSGRKQKISPMTNHRTDTDGPINGGFDRKAFYKVCEQIFDRYYRFERQVTQTFDYQNAMKHGSLEEKAAQSDLLAAETIKGMKESIQADVAHQRAKAAEDAELEEIAAILDGEKVENQSEARLTEINTSEIKDLILHIWATETTSIGMNLSFATYGLSCGHVKSSDGVEDIYVVKGAKKIYAKDIMSAKEHRTLLNNVQRITGLVPGVKVREERAWEEAEKNVSQRRHGGHSLKR